MIRTLLGKLWTLWCLLTFIVLASIFYAVEFVLIAGGDVTYRWAHRWPAFCTRLLLWSWGIYVRQHNKKILQNVPQCVIVMNHRSDLDALIATGYMPGIYKFIGKKDLEKYPFIGKLVRTLYITVDRADAASRRNSVHHMHRHSRNGANIVVFPEGWANFSNQYLLELKRGAFEVAIHNQLPVVVCTFIHTHELFPKPAIQVWPGVVDMYWETIIPTQGMLFEKDGAKLKQQVESIFIQRLKQHYPDGYKYPANQIDFEIWKQKQLKGSK